MRLTLVEVIYVYLVTVPIFFAIDLLWLGVLARDFYRRKLGYVMRPEVNWTAAILFYFLFIIGLVLFAIKPALEIHNGMHALVFGALFGFFAYATYDLTNLATIKDWPVILTIVDMVWGTALCGAVSWASYAASVAFVTT